MTCSSEPTPGGHQAVFLPALGGIADALRTELTGQVDTAMRTFTEASIQSIGRTISTFERTVNRRLEASKQEMVDNRQRLTASEAAQAATAASVEEVRRQLAMAEAQLPAMDLVALADWDRPPDPSVYTIGAPELVAPAAVRQAIGPWIADAGLTMDMVSVVGDAPSRKFHIQLLGGKDITSPRSAALARHLKLPGGAWRSFTDLAATGQNAPIYINADRSPKQVRTELQTRRLHRLLQEWYPQKSFVGRRPKGRVLLNGTPLVKLEVGASADVATKLVFNKQLVAVEGLDEAGLVKEFDSIFAEDRGITWG
ncbi:unnamed protein product [Prorocentrum cordatum]|uniref:Uncharacterized protein n=1 Tax=Prorocentrum cordatum TaxID=2364126 RepID=A0ABN9XG38_9DINO|nr:unnamed protein product [Polarella glacialis]